MKTKIICEIGINHLGSLDLAKQLIDVAVANKCQYVKFQKRTIDAVYSQAELDSVRESPWGTTFRQQKEGLEFSREAYDRIDEYCKAKGIKWLASPWDHVSVRFLEHYDLPYIKFASASITDEELLQTVKETNIPVILSTGMSTKSEIDFAIDILGNQIEYILACTSTYPCPNREMNLNKIKVLKSLYPKYKIGFSNHNPGAFFIPVAVALGAEMVEFHITMDRSMYGSDQASSIEPQGVNWIVKKIQDIEDSMGNGTLEVQPGEVKIREKLRKK